MSICRPKLLVQKENFYIAQCKHCQRIGLAYKNILAGYSPEEFENFSESVNKLEFQKHCIPFPDGNNQIIIHTCHQNIQFSFTKEEFTELVIGLIEAKMLLEAQKILSTS